MLDASAESFAMLEGMWKSFRIKIPPAHPDCPSANTAAERPRVLAGRKLALSSALAAHLLLTVGHLRPRSALR